MCITVLSLVMSITMLSSVSAKEASIEYQGLWTDYAAKEYDAGDGTKESPYLIKDASQLALLAKNVNEKEEKDKYYELISDIDLSGHFWNPVGYVKRKLNFFSGGNYFYGVFEGNNHTIKNLNIIQNNPNDDNYNLELLPLSVLYFCNDLLFRHPLVFLLFQQYLLHHCLH